MKASLRSIRIAPKKASLIAKMVRGKPVPDALTTLERTNKKAARLLEDLIRSAMANASHNEKQKPEEMVIKSLIVNKAQAYHRGYPIARGRQRVYRKFLSHITVQLGYPESEGDDAEKKEEKPKKTASQSAKKTVQKSTSTTSKAKKSSGTKATKKTTSKASSAKKDDQSPTPKTSS